MFIEGVYSCSFEQETQEHIPLASIHVHSQPLNVPVLLPQDGNLVSEEHWVQPHLRVY